MNNRFKIFNEKSYELIATIVSYLWSRHSYLRKSLYLIILAFLLCTHTTFAQYWELIPESPDSVCRMACDANNRNLWVTTFNGGVWLYDGTRWQQKSSSIGGVDMPPFGTAIAVAPNGDIYVTDGIGTIDSIGIDVNGGSVLYRSTSVYRSTNGGNSWDNVFTTPIDSFGTIKDIAISNSGEVYFAHGGRVYVPDSSSWRRANNNGVSGTLSRPIALAPNGTLYAIDKILIEEGYLHEFYIIRSTDAGNSWLRISPVLSFQPEVITVIDDNTIFITSYYSNGILKTINGGQSWTQINLNIPRALMCENIIYNSKTEMMFADIDGYVNPTCNVLISTDFGESWEVRNNGLLYSAYRRWGLGQYCFAFNPTTGATYLRVANDHDSYYFRWVGPVYRYVLPVRVIIKDNYRVKSNETVKISIDAIDDLSVSGKNAKDFSFTLKYNKRILSFKDVSLTGTISNSLRYSTEGSTPGELVVKVINNTETPLIGTGSLIDINFIGLRGDSCGTRLVLESFAFNSDGPNAIIEKNGYCELFGGCGGEGQTYITTDQTPFLRQNSPNPILAGYESTIEYRIHVAGEINLTVYDILGREVTKLVNEYKPEGTYSVTFNTKGLPSGVYFYRLRAPGYEGLKKMIVIK